MGDSPKVRPCDSCRAKHLKCDYEGEVCSRCVKNGTACSRSKPHIKFRRGSSKRYDSGFSKQQVWLRTSAPSSCDNYVDETPDIIVPTQRNRDIAFVVDQAQQSATSNTLGPSSAVVPTRLSPQRRLGADTVTPGSRGRRAEASDHEAWIATEQSPRKRRRLNSGSLRRGFAIEPDGVHFNNLSSLTSKSLQPDSGPSSVELRAISVGPQVSRSSEGDFQPLGRIEGAPTEWTAATLTEATLMRFWVRELASWFDLCDSERHFALVGVDFDTSFCQSSNDLVLPCRAIV